MVRPERLVSDLFVQDLCEDELNLFATTILELGAQPVVPKDRRYLNHRGTFPLTGQFADHQESLIFGPDYNGEQGLIELAIFIG